MGRIIMNATMMKKVQRMKRGNRDEYYASRNWHIIEAALEYFISIMVTGAFLARITRELGFSDSLTGIISAFVSLGCVFQLGAIIFFRGTQHVKRPVIILQGINEILFATVYLCPILPLGRTAKTVLFLICFCGGYMLLNLLRSPKSNWMISLVSDGERGIFTAKKEMFSLISGMIFTYVMGSMIDYVEAAGNSRMAFVIGVISMCVLMGLHISNMLLIKEKPREAAEKKSPLESVKELINNKPLMRVILAISIWNVGYFSAIPFYGVYQINELGFSMTFVSVLSIGYSIVRTIFSPMMGRLGDRKSFSYMCMVCFIIAFFSFLVNCFTVPENGKIFYSLYYCLFAVSMAGASGAQANMVYDLIKGENRQNALAFTLAICGVVGFVTTCLMSPVVDMIQKNGNQVLGIPMYAQQFVSGVACVMTLISIIYMKKNIIGKQEKEASEQNN